MSKIRFKGLNELRGIAALSVMVHHIELYKFRENLPNLHNTGFLNQILMNLGINGVLLFFSLSGFLITYLLLEEKREFGQISIRQFYIRRVLRIWPLYFITIFIGFFLLPAIYKLNPQVFDAQLFASQVIKYIQYGRNFQFFLLFLSNISLNNFPPVLAASQSWSVSVEEQFYLVWPWLILIFHKRLPLVFIAIIALVPIVRFYILEENLGQVHQFIRGFIDTFHIDFMAMGALLAYLYFHFRAEMENWVRNPLVMFFTLTTAIILLYVGDYRLIRLVSFTLLIPMAIIWNFEFKLMDHLGKISYGLYMYHSLPLFFGLSLLQYFKVSAGQISWLLYPIVIIGTYVISLASFHFIESPLLKLKEKFYPKEVEKQVASS